jgi:hypothetical protein
MAATGDEDEERGLLDDEESPPRGSSDALSVAVRKQEDRTTRQHVVGDGFTARVVAAWTQPVGTPRGVPVWLTKHLVPTQDEQDSILQLRQLADVAYNKEDATHERALLRFFAAVRSPEEARNLPSGGDPRWKDLGFQSEDPRTDFRGGGLLALQNMCHLAENYPEQIQDMIREAAGKRNGYLFAAACVNVSSIVVLLLGLNTRRGLSPAKGMPCPANAMARKRFARILSSLARPGAITAAEVLAELFSCGVMKLHAEWAAVCARKPEATLLDFGEALVATAVALEHLLDSLQPSDSQPLQSVFSKLDFIKPAHWITKSQLYLYRWISSMLEVACRLTAALSELFCKSASLTNASEL